LNSGVRFMNDNIALVILASAFLLPVSIYLAGKLSDRISNIAYKILGTFCLICAAGFFVFVAWFFFTTGQLVFPSRRGSPAQIIGPEASLDYKLFIGSFNVLVGSALAYSGLTMLRIKHPPPDQGHET
ncbi:hypothetical protein, partial [Solilutibacter silvestris]|uniref:hypothetical protein n=1 Tax=Solilutibacter silvestris TaxID=1645665 RepID=UPI003D32A4EE